jgi:magnesium-transporting ATPase (P-type)
MFKKHRLVLFVCIVSFYTFAMWYYLRMKFLLSFGLVLLSLPFFTLAQSPQDKAAAEAASFVAKFNEVILFPLIALMTAVAFLVFLWGCAQYLFYAANDQARQQGVKHITFGIIGLVVMLSAYAILQIAAATFGLNDELDCANDPSGAGCGSVFVVPGGTSGTGASTGSGTSGTGASTGSGIP